MRIRFLVTITILLMCGFLTESAEAYSPGDTVPGARQELKWRAKKIIVSVSNVFPEGPTGSLARSYFESNVRESFLSWARETGIEVSFRSVAVSSVSGKKSGGDGVSLVTIAPTADNLLLFSEKDASKSAVTRLFFDSEGFITEADTVLNPTAWFTNDGSRGSFDLKSTLMHESGHFLGLGHSDVVGATMHKHQGKNGVFALPATYSRTLSEDDKAGIRSLYGAPAGRSAEFGAIEGILDDAGSGNLSQGGRVWVESLKNGKVFAAIRPERDGSFVLKSVPVDGYRIFSAGSEGELLSDGHEIIVESGVVAKIRLRTRPFEKDTEFFGVFGFNGQLSDLAIPVETGHTYSFVFGSKGLLPGKVRIESSAAGVFVDSDSIASLYSFGNLNVVGFEVFVSSAAESGDYSLRIYEGDRLVSQVPGIVTIDDVHNPWYSASF